MPPIQSLNRLSVHLNDLVKGRLWLKVIIALILGSAIGVFLNPSMGLLNTEQSETWSTWLNLPGEVFMKLVQMVMVPLILASVISGLVSNVTGDLKKFGLGLLLFFLITSVIATAIGVAMALLFKPGNFIKKFGDLTSGSSEVETTEGVNTFENIPESISNLIPVNPLESILTGEMLSIVIFSIIIGIAIMQLDTKTSAPIIKFIEALQKICMIIIGWAMKLIPYAVFGLMAALLSTTGLDIFLGLGYYMMVVIIGLLLLMILYMVIYYSVMRKNPFKFLSQITDPLLLAFSTTSSAAVMPLSMKVADEKLNVDSKISDFVIPVGATVNMTGTALFQCLTIIFMAQIYEVELSMMNIILITTTVVSASIGTPAIPGGGVIILATVMSNFGIPADGILIIVGLDRILGMFRTAVNVTGDLTATVIFNKWFGNKETLKHKNSV